jgi:hypothetical protein
LPTQLTTIEASTFEGCSALVELEIPEGITTIGNAAFKNCTSFVGVNTDKLNGTWIDVLIVPNAVTAIGSEAFSGCSSLTDLWLGSKVSTIGDLAFSGNTLLTTITATPTTAPTLAAKSVFSDDTYANATLNLSTADALDSYKADDNYWQYFFHEADNKVTTGISSVDAATGVSVKASGMTIEVSGNVGSVAVYNMAGAKVYQGRDNSITLGAKGVYVVVVDNASHKVVLK